MTIKHLIILTSSYSTGKRIVLHYLEDEEEEYRDAIEKIRQAYDGKTVSFSLHTIFTDSGEWASVVARDPYFDDVVVIDSVGEFVDLIRKSRYVTGLHVAKYILSKCRCTHTRLEKLTYFCYADYLCSTGEKLFDDTIFAFDYGPVVYGVYQKYSADSRESPGSVLPIDEDELPSAHLEMPHKSRIVFSEDGLKKIASIDRTLEKLKDIPTAELVERTHRADAPWSFVDRKGLYARIPDDLILEHHAAECD